jgi:2-amino-4-hydroxy-6-hydroxymethyldihydropteridine diphosphokinase
MNRNVFLGLGSNVGDRLLHLTHAICAIDELEYTFIEQCSAVYETEPVGEIDQDTFLNMVVAVSTGMDVDELYASIKRIEHHNGRQYRKKWGPREIDIDILLFNDLQVQSELLTIPHREMTQRKFVLEPLHEIAPGIMIPGIRKSVAKVYHECSDTHRVVRSAQFTEVLTYHLKDLFEYEAR